MKLLVSVTNVSDALEALAGGAHIIDVKRPEEGALGASNPELVKEIRKKLGRAKPLSVTIGDLPYLPGTASFAALGAATCGADFVKAGLYGCHTLEAATKMGREITKTLRCTNAKTVLAAYGDYGKFKGLDPTLLPSIASRVDADGIIVDIQQKGEQRVFDYLGDEALSSLNLEAKKVGLLTALAGGLNAVDASRTNQLGFSIMGVRRAACRPTSKGAGGVSRKLVSKLLESVQKSNTKSL
jgi:hypothetical protein